MSEPVSYEEGKREEEILASEYRSYVTDEEWMKATFATPVETLVEGHGAPEVGVIRFILHPALCKPHKIMDEHWVEVYTGISWINWHMKLFAHLRSKHR